MDYSKLMNGSDENLQKTVQKAIICVKDLNNAQLQSNKTYDANQTTNTAFALEKAYRTQAKSPGGSIDDVAKSQGFKVVKVQFNPTELSFSSSPTSDNGKKNSPSENMMLSKAVQTIMTVPLIFEEINETDAFVWDKQQALISGSMKERLGANSLAQTLLNYSVKTQIDGFLSLLANSITRNVVFCWGNIALSGIIQSEEAEYTMFNPSGNPIMGTVTLKIAVNHGQKGTSNGKYWDKAFDQLFTVKKSNMAEDLTNVVGTVSKLMKFNG